MHRSYLACCVEGGSAFELGCHGNRFHRNAYSTQKSEKEERKGGGVGEGGGAYVWNHLIKQEEADTNKICRQILSFFFGPTLCRPERRRRNQNRRSWVRIRYHDDRRLSQPVCFLVFVVFSSLKRSEVAFGSTWRRLPFRFRPWCDGGTSLWR